MKLYPILIIAFSTLAFNIYYTTVEAQTLDRSLEESSDGNQVGPVFRRMLNGAMSVNVPVFYDMIKDGTSMGINVLQGLVKVERGQEAERNGLMGNGRRPLSVRVFGIPVYERGLRVREPDNVDRRPRPTNEPKQPEPEYSKPADEEEELPIEQ